jgi:hypothetical protein
MQHRVGSGQKWARLPPVQVRGWLSRRTFSWTSSSWSMIVGGAKKIFRIRQFMNMDTETVSVIGTVMAAFAAVAAVVISWVVYTGQRRLSKSIANDQSALSARIASEQLEGSSRPCVLVLEDADELREFSARNLILQNIGSGPALNIRWRLSAWSEWGTCASPQSKTHQEQCIRKISLTSGSNFSVGLNNQSRATSS